MHIKMFKYTVIKYNLIFSKVFVFSCLANAYFRNYYSTPLFFGQGRLKPTHQTLTMSV